MKTMYAEVSEEQIEFFKNESTKLCNILCSIKRPNNISSLEFNEVFQKLCAEFIKLYISQPLKNKKTQLTKDEINTILSNITNLAIATTNQNIKCLNKAGKKTRHFTNKTSSEVHIREKIAKSALEFNKTFENSDFSFMYFSSILCSVVSKLNKTSNPNTLELLINDLL